MFRNHFKNNDGSRPIESFPVYTIASGTKFRMHYHITISLHLNSGNKWIGSIVMHRHRLYKVMHRPKFI